MLDLGKDFAISIASSLLIERMPQISRGIIILLSNLLPINLRHRYRDEWLADLETQTGPISKLLYAIYIIPNAYSIAISNQTDYDATLRRQHILGLYYFLFITFIPGFLIACATRDFIENNGLAAAVDMGDAYGIAIYTILISTIYFFIRKRYAASEEVGFLSVLFIFFPMITLFISTLQLDSFKVMNTIEFSKYILIIIELEIMHPRWRHKPVLILKNKKYLPKMIGKQKYIRAKISLNKSLRRDADLRRRI